MLLHAAHNKLYDLQISSSQISQHLAEVNFRLLGYLYKQLRRVDDTTGSPSEVIFAADELYVMNIYNAEDQRELNFNSMLQSLLTFTFAHSYSAFTTQWALTLHFYFKIWDNQYIDANLFRNSFHAHPFIREYTWNFWKEVDGEFTKKQIHPATIAQITATLKLIHGALHRLLEEDRGQSLDCLFYPRRAVYSELSAPAF